MKLSKFGLIPIMGIGALLLLTTCQDKESSSPKIAAIEPTRGWKGMIVKITGMNFDPMISGNTVLFGTQRASVVSSTPTEIIVKAPDSESGIVSIATENGSARGPVFSYAIVPRLDISYATLIDASEATLNAELTEITGHEIIDHGFIFSKNELTSFNQGERISLSSTAKNGKLQKRLANLSSKQKYFFSAFVTIGEGDIVTDQLSFETIDVNLWGKTAELPLRNGWDVFRKAGVEIKGKVYLGFGATTDGIATRIPVFEYDPTTALFTKLTDFPDSYRHATSVLAILDTLYIGLGYFSNGVNSKDIWSFNPSSKVWKKGKDFPIDINKTTSFVLNNRGYVIGLDVGLKKSGIWEYSVAQNLWLERKAPPSDLIEPIDAFSINGKGYVIGVSSNIGSPSPLWEYDPINDGWTSKANLPLKFNNAVICLSTEKKGYVIQTYIDDSFFFVYSPANNTWRELPKAPFSAQSGFTHSNKIFAADKNYVYTYLPEQNQ